MIIIFYTLSTKTIIVHEINVTYNSMQSAIFLNVFLSLLGTWPSLFSSMVASLICVSMSMSLLMIHLEFMFLKMDLSDLQLASKWVFSCIKLVCTFLVKLSLLKSIYTVMDHAKYPGKY